ncbi:restriction endonuclease subunit S [Providencia huaxiensis]|uniref:restriction endonuclease subunit S n=1 Tax=Providencia huaxiensis TaxID=2027290 RepID=UPI0032DB284B
MSEFTEWKTLQFKDICRLKSDKVTVDSSDIQTYISTENMLPNFGGVQSAKNIPLTGKLNTFKYGDVLFSNIRTYFKKVWIATFDGVASPDVLIFSAMKNCESQYLYYMMCEPQFTEFTVLTSRGAKMPRGDKEAILNYEISLPSLAEQKAIASVLSSLDNKIDLLHRQNKTLESMAETLFRQWFVEEAQDDWNEVRLGQLFSICSGKGLKRDEFIELGMYPVLGANGEIGRCNKSLYSERLIYTGRVGTLGNIFIIHENEKVWLSDNTLIFKDIKYFYFVYFQLKMINFDEYNVGSTQPLIRQSDIKEIYIDFPNDLVLLDLFERDVDIIFTKINKNIQKIKTLEKLRDTLLPKLMSGEVRVNYTPEEIKQ